MKELRMTIPQFNAYQRGEITLYEIKTLNGVEILAEKILQDPNITKITAFVIAGVNIASRVSAESIDAISKIDSAGLLFFNIIQSIGYWLCLIGCILEILKGIMNGQGKDVGRIMIKYLMIFSALYLMPWAFDLVKDIFQ